MADSKKCDVCGRLYETPICNDAVRIHLDFGYAGDRYIDLCEDCYNKLCNFVKPALPKDYSVERKGFKDVIKSVKEDKDEQNNWRYI